jgi:hypothetical protein
MSEAWERWGWTLGVGLLGSFNVLACARGDAKSRENVATPATETAVAPAPSQAPEALVPANPKARQRCAAICEKTRTLRCKQPDACLPNCLAMASTTPCSEELSAFQACLANQPTEHWECDESTGVAQVREGYCEAEQARGVSCMEDKMKQP